MQIPVFESRKPTNADPVRYVKTNIGDLLLLITTNLYSGKVNTVITLGTFEKLESKVASSRGKADTLTLGQPYVLHPAETFGGKIMVSLEPLPWISKPYSLAHGHVEVYGMPELLDKLASLEGGTPYVALIKQFQRPYRSETSSRIPWTRP